MIFNNEIWPGLDGSGFRLPTFIFGLLYIWEDFEIFEDAGTWRE